MRAVTLFAHLMSSSVSVQARTGLDRYGMPTYGAATSYRCHVSSKRRLVRDERGQEVVSSQAVYLASSVAVEPTAKVTLSTGDVGSTAAGALSPDIITVDRRFDESGAHHTVLFLV